MTIPIPATILHAEDAINLLQNPTFEDGTTGWQGYGGTLTYTNNPVHTGSRAAVLIANEAEAYIFQTVHVLAGHTYIFSGWTYQNDLYEPIIFLRISWYGSENGAGGEISQNDSLGLVYKLSNYSFLTTDHCIAPANAHSAIVKGIVKIAAPNQPASVYFDDMTFIETITAPTSTPTPTPTPTPSSTCAPDLLTNPGFEEGITGWQSYRGNLSQVASPVHDGNFAAALITESFDTKLVHQLINIQGNGTYCFSGYVWKNDPGIERVHLEVWFYDNPEGDGSYLFRYPSTEELISDVASYRFLSTGERTAPSNARSARVNAIVVPHSATPATVYFDDFSFVGPALSLIHI